MHQTRHKFLNTLRKYIRDRSRFRAIRRPGWACEAVWRPNAAVRYSIKVRWILGILTCAACAQTLQLPGSVKQGGTLRIHGPASAVAARMGDRNVRLFPQTEGRSFGLMPVAMDRQPGEYKLELLDAKDAAVAAANVTVLDGHFLECRRAFRFPRRRFQFGEALSNDYVLLARYRWTPKGEVMQPRTGRANGSDQ